MKRFIIILAVLLWASTAHAVSTLTVRWQDNSSNEEGFNIERASSSSGPFSRIGAVGSNVTSYTNTNLAEATNFCYRINAFNSSGASPFTPVVCGVTKATLSLNKSGAGSGRVTSLPAGINCTGACAVQFSGNSNVTLTATVAAGSVFAGWSGACTGTGSCTVTMNSQKSVTANFTSGEIPVAADIRGPDFDGDNKADVAVYLNGAWRIVRSSNGTLTTVTLGSTAQDLAVPGDYDGDDAADVAVYNATTGKWSVIGSTAGTFTASPKFGGPGFIPVAGDYDGDGKTDVAVYHAATGNWFVAGSTEGYFTPALNFGGSTYVPVPGDYDGDGMVDAAVYHIGTGNWFVFGSSAGFFSPALNFGGSGYVPVPGDYDGDGITDAAVYDKVKGHWFVVGTTTGYFNPALNFGGSGYVPVQGDYDGDGKTDAAVYQPSIGNWFLVQSTTGFKASNNGGNNFTPVVPQLTILKALGLM